MNRYILFRHDGTTNTESYRLVNIGCLSKVTGQKEEKGGGVGKTKNKRVSKPV